MIKNEFSWSHSRDEAFERCRRAYYLSYYAAWGGWARHSSKLSQAAYRLKKLDNRWSWAGRIVHAVISRTLTTARKAQAPTEVEAQRRIAFALDTFRAEYLSSRDGRRDAKNDRGFWGLAEHEYAEDVPREAWAALWETTRASLEWFFASGWIERVRASGDNLLELDSGAFDESGHFFADGVKVWAVPDLALLEGGGALAVDWKTGRPKPGHLDQLVGYALYLSAKYGSRGASLDLARATIVYLGAKTEQSVDVSRTALHEFGAKLRASVSEMRGLLVDAAGNEPKPMEEFEKTENRDECRNCVFRRLCDRG